MTKRKDSITPEQIGESMKRVRAGKFISVVDLSEMTGIERHRIYEYERGEKLPKTLTLVKLADALGVSIDHYVGRDRKQVLF